MSDLTLKRGRKNIGIVGSGVAGLAIAIRLAASGERVTVYEKNNYPGGKLSKLSLGQYHFDAGPSLFTQPQNIEELFTIANKEIKNYFKYRRENIACNYFFESGKSVKAFSDREKFAKELNLKLGEDPKKVIKYLTDAQNAYSSIGNIFLNKSLHKLSTWINADIIEAIKNTKLNYLFATLHKHNKKSFKTQEAQQIFNRFATYNGSNPFKAPAMLSMIPHLEHNEGTFYPIGGMISITNALYKLALDLNIQFYFDCDVKKIVRKDGKVSGIIANDKFYPHDCVVSNVDVYYTYKHLLDEFHYAEKINKQERSSSAIIFYWGIKKSFSALGLHNIFFSRNYKEEFECIFKKGGISNDPTVYINITSKIDSDHAPEGCENWFVMVNAPCDTGQNWEELRSRCRNLVIDKLSRNLNEDIDPLIEEESYLDPTIIDKRTGSYKGSLYGTSSNSPFSAFLRHKNWSSRCSGLFFVGGSVHPGGGIPLCLKSAKITSEIIKNT